jgi:hypothetical protein
VLDILLRVRVALLLSICAFGIGCDQHPAPPPDATTVLQAIPAADPANYGHIADMKKWRNPYLIVRADSFALWDSVDSAEIILKPDEVLPALARQPAKNWPYGRVVAAAENTPAGSDQDAVAIRRNKGILGGILEGAHIAVKWVPSS